MRQKRGQKIALKGALAICLLVNNFSSFGAVIKATTTESEDVINSEVNGDLSGSDEMSPEEILPSETPDNEETEKPEENLPEEIPGDEETEKPDGDLPDEIPGDEEIEKPEEEETEGSENNDDVTLEDEEIDESEVVLEAEELLSIESRSSGSGLVQLWQVVPDGQQSKEGKTTAQIMSALQCKPNHNLYPSGGASEHNTYVNSCYVDDALYLGEDANYYYIYLSGFEGKVPKSESQWFELDLNNDGTKVKYEIQTVAYYIPAGTTMYSLQETTEPLAVPELNYYDQYLDKYNDLSELSEDGISMLSSSTVQSPSYYANESGTLIHYVTNNVTKAGSYSKVTVGKAPTWMNSGVKYYSYDGIYFYTNWRNIKVNGQGSVNQSNPFYNYYQYLPFRSKSNYSASVFDSYTNSNGGAGGKLVNTGQYFYAVQNNYGINGGLQYAMGIHESGWGKSSLSIDKNNLFGMNATDNNPYGNGTSFPSVEAGINYHADRYLSWGYTDPIDDWRYFGSHVGNKGSGMNVKYASDPFWGEKIAGWYYRFDNASGLKDYNYYTIGIKQSNAVVDVKSQANSSSSTLYQTKNKKSNIKIANYPVLIIGEQNGYYKLQTDTPIFNGSAKFNAQYKWGSSYGYVSKNNIIITNHSNYKAPSSWKQATAVEHSVAAVVYNNSDNLTIGGRAYIPYLEMRNAQDTDIYIILKDPQNNDTYYKATRNTNGYGIISGYDYSYSGFEVNIPSKDILKNGNYQLYIKVVDNSDGSYMINKLAELSNPTSVVNKDLGRKKITVSSNNGISILAQDRLVDELAQQVTVMLEDTVLQIKGKAYIPYYEASKINSISTSIILKNPKGQDKYFDTTMTNDGYGMINNYDYTYSGFEIGIPVSNLNELGEYQLLLKIVDNATGHTVIKKVSNLTNTGDVLYRGVGDTVLSVAENNGVKVMVEPKAIDVITQSNSVNISNNSLVVEGKAYIPNYEMSKVDDVSIQIILKNPSQKDHYFNVERNTSGYGTVNSVNYTYSGYKVAIPSNYLGELGTYQLLIKMVDKETGHTVIKNLSNLTNSGSVNQQLIGNFAGTVKEDNGIKLTLSSRKIDAITQSNSVSISNNNLVIEGKAYIPNYEMSKVDDVSIQIILKNPSQKDYYFNVERNTSGYGMVNSVNYTYSGYKVAIPSNYLGELGTYQLLIKMVDKETGHTVIKNLSNLTNSGSVNQQLIGNFAGTVKEDNGIKLTLSSRKIDAITQSNSVSISNNNLVIEGKAYIPNYEMSKVDDVSIQIILKNPSQKDYYFNVERNTSGYGMVNSVNYTCSGYKVAIPSNYLGEIGTYQLLIKMVDKTTGHTVIKNLSNLTNNGAVNQQLIGNFLGTVKENNGINLNLVSR